MTRQGQVTIIAVWNDGVGSKSQPLSSRIPDRVVRNIQQHQKGIGNGDGGCSGRLDAKHSGGRSY
jgi:hypothetical protein